jgi:hypothetical protein
MLKNLFTQKIVAKLSKIWVWDPGVKKAPDRGSGSATLVPTFGRAVAGLEPPGSIQSLQKSFIRPWQLLIIRKIRLSNLYIESSE